MTNKPNQTKKPTKPTNSGVFGEDHDVTHILVVATNSHIYIFALEFEGGGVGGELSLLPTELVVPTEVEICSVSSFFCFSFFLSFFLSSSSFSFSSSSKLLFPSLPTPCIISDGLHKNWSNFYVWGRRVPFGVIISIKRWLVFVKMFEN